ncbi:MAG: hypothetical protein PHY70_06015, partial [Methanocellales archaeon]|nr:hypothetical protein [Methanocellales archaeon]
MAFYNNKIYDDPDKSNNIYEAMFSLIKTEKYVNINVSNIMQTADGRVALTPNSSRAIVAARPRF